MADAGAAACRRMAATCAPLLNDVAQLAFDGWHQPWLIWVAYLRTQRFLRGCELRCGWWFCTAGDGAAAAQFLLLEHRRCCNTCMKWKGLIGINMTREEKQDSDVF